MSVEKKRLAIVSAYGELCGIAGYTFWLKRQLEECFHVEVFSLEQKYLKRSSKNGVKIGDQLIENICKTIETFDYVNFQFEPGTLAPDLKLALKRYRKILDASKQISITFHTVERDIGLRYTPIIKSLARGKVRDAVNELRKARADRVWDGFYNYIKETQGRKKASVIVHTKREKDFFEIDYNIENVYDHPLSFLKKEDIEEIKATASRGYFKNLKSYGDDVTYIGLFGFLAPYKGVTTAIKALTLLPKNYHLLLFGGIHPNEMKKGQMIDNYLKEIHSSIETMMLSEVRKEKNNSPSTLVKASSGSIAVSLSDAEPRVHFMGALDDMDFLRGMEVCEYVVTPYTEVGQSGSGPMTMALEMGAKLLTARTKLTEQMRHYYPNAFVEFEIGNYMQLADYIREDNAVFPGHLAYNWKTNKAIYLEALGVNMG